MEDDEGLCRWTCCVENGAAGLHLEGSANVGTYCLSMESHLMMMSRCSIGMMQLREEDAVMGRGCDNVLRKHSNLESEPVIVVLKQQHWKRVGWWLR